MTAERSIDLVRVFDAPRELVFQNWLDPACLEAWFAPEGFTVTACTVDARPGGSWRVEYRSDAGERYLEHGVFEELAPPQRLVLTLTQEHGGRAGPRTRVTVELVERGAQTELRFCQTGFESTAHRDGNAEGWLGCFRQLDQAMASERATRASEQATAELRALHEAWFRASSARDLDASMAPIASDIVSYEHEAPLVYRGVDAIRETCRRGFEAATGDLRWDVPDLQIHVSGDLAITWGLNRMRVCPPGGPAVESWSRGTRVFQKFDGAWRLIHQHVSFPIDLATGQARTDLVPEQTSP